MVTLYGHTSAETAYIQTDYPYGLRRYWIETKEGFGQRMVSQTVNPKTHKANKPKAGTYSTVLALYLDAENHVQSWGLTGYSQEDDIAKWVEASPAADDNYTREAVRYLRAAIRAQAHYSVTITVGEGKRQTRAEQAAIVGKAIRRELWEDTRRAVREFR